MSQQDDKHPDYPGEGAADEEIEILEVVGMGEDDEPLGDDLDGEEAPADEPSDLVLAFEDDGPDRPAGPHRAARPPVESGIPLDPERQLVQIRADYENLRKRVERERREYEEHANAALVARLLPVLDNFERALAVPVEGDSDAAFRQGVELIYKHLRDELRREGLHSIEAEGQPFDPTVHDAVAAEPGVGDGIQRVAEELQRGYLFRDRLLRPAQVRVQLGDAPVADAGEDD